MYFKRKVYSQLLDWKEKYADKYGILLEGARRVGKSTIVEVFAKNEYKSYILVDFANIKKTVKDCFDDIADPDMFFRRLQMETGIQLYEHESVIIFDEIQLFPPARQAIKYLVKDGRYHFIETGSLISIKKNVKDILIPSEEMRLEVFPMDYEEFLWATKIGEYNLYRELYANVQSVGQGLNRKLMRDFRIYMAVGGMPQAVEAYIDKKSFAEIDRIKREIILLYEEDFKKIDSTGSISAMYHSIPSQLSRDVRKYSITSALSRQTTREDELLIDSKTVLISHNSTNPQVSLSLTEDSSSYKLYMADTGLFVTLMFMDRPIIENELYSKLMADKLPANLGYLYENAVAQTIAATNRQLYYHTWDKPNSTHYYEVDFLISRGTKITPIEVKSSGTGKHESITEFCRKYSKYTTDPCIFSQKDLCTVENITNLPIYLLLAFLEM